MDFAQGLFAFIGTYGYLAVFIGSIIDGEVVILLAGLLGQQDNLSFPLILLFAFLGAIVNDMGWFLAGKYGGVRLLNRFSLLARFMKKPVGIAQRNPRMLCIFMRFMYGFRTIIPFSIGMSDIPMKTFFFWNTLGAVLWTVVFGGAGFLLGAALESFFGRIKHIELLLIILVILGFTLFHTIAKIAKKRLKRAVIENELPNEETL